MNPTETPLRWLTPRAWTRQVMEDPLALLNDHAHLEKKAASNALELLHRWPSGSDGQLAQHWAAVLTGVARDEVEHLATVTRLLARRGGKLSKTHRNPYAAQLRGLVRTGRSGELVDRLLVCALIEVRSCERFELLAEHVDDDELARIYRRLSVSERGHYAVFVELARRVAPAEQVDSRWEQMLESEAAIIVAQPTGPRMHSGVG
jgi:tRNA-(ms[2]io[6]A)-hydroxylase